MVQAVTQTVPLSWAIVLSPIMTAGLTLVTAYLGWRAKKDKDEVKETLKQTSTATSNSLNEIHTLVNSKMERQMLMLSLAARALADLTKRPDLIKAADDAETELAEHRRNQKLLDSK
jgi:hypothetical protein